MARLPFLAAGALMLIFGIGGGLARFGWPLAPTPGALVWHGPLVVGAFFGTVISLERAAAMERRWIYVAPFLAAAGGLAGLANMAMLPWLLMMAAAAVLCAAYLVAMKPHRERYLGVMALGALAWLGAALLTLAGSGSTETAPLWMSFLIFTIAGERVEMSRFVAPTPWNSRFAGLSVGLLAFGAGMAAAGYGLLIFGLGELICGFWLLRFDAARRSRKLPGLPGFMGRALFWGYGWLLAAGVFTVYGAISGDANLYDAQLHAVFLGFVMSMIFGHAPMVVPMLLGKSISFTPAFYWPLALLHVSLLVRIGSGWLGHAAVLRWAALANALALLLFIILAIISVKSHGAAATSQSPLEGH